MSSAAPIAPADARELIEIVREAAASRTALQVVGGGTRSGMGNPHRQTSRLSMENFQQVIDYDAEELVLTTEVGVPLARIQRLLDARHQMLAFEPAVQGGSTIGGMVATGWAGPRRVSAGNVRDHVLGFSAVSGRAEAFIAGGRVVKNVTGYDLPKLLCGSWGQLAVLTQVTLKVLPKPRSLVTLQVSGVDDQQAVSLMTLALRSQAAPAAAAFFPAGTIDSRSQTLLRMEGFPPSVDTRIQILQRLLPDFVLEPADTERAAKWWTLLCSGYPLGAPGAAQTVWRICVPASSACRVTGQLSGWKGKYCLDWGGHLIFAQLPASASAVEVRKLAEDANGHATLLHAPLELRAAVPALHPEPEGVAALSARVKQSFDPESVLDPQRFAASAE